MNSANDLPHALSAKFITTLLRCFLLLGVFFLASLPKEALAEGVGSSGNRDLEIVVDPTATFLRFSRDPDAKPAAFVRLADLDIVSGDLIRLTRLGDFRYHASNPSNLRGMMGVFSSSSTLLAGDQHHRVKGAIEAGTDLVTAPTLFDRLDTDIPEDFEIGDTVVQVPLGAKYLFYAAQDVLYGDNADPEADFRLRITNLECRTPTSRTATWEGGGDGVSWEDPTNWSGGMVPQDCDAVVINGPADLVVRFANLETHIRSLTLGATLEVEGGLLAIQQPLTPSGAFVVHDGTVAFTGGLTVNNSKFTQTGGQVVGSVVLINSALQLGDGSTGIASYTTRLYCTLSGNISPRQSVTILTEPGWNPARLKAANSFTNHGRIVLHAEGNTAGLVVDNGSKLVNAKEGRIEVTGSASSTHGITAAILNEGLLLTQARANLAITLNAAQLFENIGATITLGGKLTVTGGGVILNGGTIENHPQSPEEIVMFSLTGSRFDYVAGINSVLTELIDSGLRFGKLGTAPGTYITRLGCTLSGNISPAQTITILTEPGWNPATLKAAGSVTNHGRVVLHAEVSASQLLVEIAGKLVNAKEGTIEVNGPATGSHGITAAIRNEGLLLTQPTANLAITLNAAQLFENIGATLTLGGKLKVAGGGVVLNGGTIENHPQSPAEIVMISLTGSRFDYLAGDNSVLTELIDSGLRFGELGTAPGNYLTRLECTLSGNVSSEQNITILTEPGWNPSTLKAAHSVTNHGRMVLDAEGSACALVVQNGGELVNAKEGTIEVRGSAAGSHGITAAIRNEGLLLTQPATSLAITLNPAQLFENVGATLTLGGKLKVVGGGVVFNGGTIENHPQSPVEIVMISLTGSRFDYRAGVNSVVTELIDSGLRFGALGTAPGNYLARLGCTLSGNISPAQTITILTEPGWNPATLKAANSVTNHGRMVLHAEGSASQLVVENGGKLVNAKDGTIEVTGGSSGSHGITAAIRNDGLLLTQLAASLSINLSSQQTFEQSGIVLLNNASLTVTGGRFVNTATGLVQGVGTFATANAIFVNQGIISPGAPLGVLTFTGRFVQSPSGKISIEIGGSNPGTDFDQVVLPAGAAIDGSLEAMLKNGYTPSTNDSFAVIAASAYSGRFSEVSLPRFANCAYLAADYEANTISLLTRVDCPPPIDSKSLVVTNNTFMMVVSGVPDSRFLLEKSTDLIHWTPVSTNVVGADGKVLCSDPALSGEPHRFFRTAPFP